jgi:hypothetical protein
MNDAEKIAYLQKRMPLVVQCFDHLASWSKQFGYCPLCRDLVFSRGDDFKHRVGCPLARWPVPQQEETQKQL